MKYLKVIAFTHKQIDLKELGEFVICNETRDDRLRNLQKKFDIPEIFYLGTCNRVEFVFCASQSLSPEFVKDFIRTLNFCLPEEKLEDFSSRISVYEDVEAMNHLLRISCSLESLVVGEKEILSQVRKAYDCCREAGFTGDYLRMIMTRVVKTAKEVYTHTNIAKKPISVVSLAYRKLRDLNMFSNSRIIIIGAGDTNKHISKYLQKHKFSNFAIFNRTFSKAQELAKELNGKAFPLSELSNYKEGFDVIITCTGAVEPVINNETYTSLLNNEKGRKVIVDMGIPNDTCPEVLKNNPVHFIDIKSLEDIANQNLKERCAELVHAQHIIDKNMLEFKPVLHQRRVEIAMREVPEKIKEIKHVALNTVFATEVQALDENSREVLEKVMNYMEKKYIKVPMLMAKDILVNNS